MHSTTRAIWKIFTIGALVLGGLVFAASAGASDRHRGEQSSPHLNILSFVAALHGDAILAYALHLTGDRIGHRHGGHDSHQAHYGREIHRRHHRHFAGCGHANLRHRFNHYDRFDSRRSHGHKHRRHGRHHH